ncbi:MAG: ABC transporter substrate-binding protein, partial [Janthinobacterium lividum]
LGITSGASAKNEYSPGATDTEIKLGQTMPYSGAASSLSELGRAETAYFNMINASGGINGRKINLVSLDDGFSPPKTVEQVRNLVEQENVLALVGSMGTAGNLAVAKYLNAKKVPQLLAASSSPALNDRSKYPWTNTFFASSANEARIYAHYLLKVKPNAKIGVLYQNDDYGKGYLESFRQALGDRASSMIVKEASYDLGDPTIDSQVLTLMASGADTFFQATTPKYATQAIRKAADVGWKPLQLVLAAVASKGNTLEPAGLDKSKGIVTSIYLKMPGDPMWDKDPAMQEYQAFMKRWAPQLTANDAGSAMGYSVAQLTVEILKRAGNNLTRQNVLDQANHIKDFQLPLFITGVKIDYTRPSHVAWSQAQMVRFDGNNFVPFGELLDADK